MSTELQNLIDLAWEGRTALSPTSADPKIVEAVEHVIADLNAGRLRVAERQGVGQWTVNQWVKKAVLLSFRLKDNHVVRSGDLSFFDKVETKFAQVTPILSRVMDVRLPDAGFYLWAGIDGDDIAWAQGLLAQYNVTVLPGSLLARTAHGHNPGSGRIRMALVASVDECLEAAHRIVSYTESL